LRRFRLLSLLVPRVYAAAPCLTIRRFDHFVLRAPRPSLVRIDYSAAKALNIAVGRVVPPYAISGGAMPLFLIERQFADALEVTAADVTQIQRINADAGVNWVFSFLSADRKKTYCLYEAPSAEAIRLAARMANLPVDAVIEVSQVRPEAFA